MTTTALAAREYLTTEDLAELLQVSVQTVRSWRFHRTGPRGVRLGRRVRYRRVDVDRWVEANARAQRTHA